MATTPLDLGATAIALTVGLPAVVDLIAGAVLAMGLAVCGLVATLIVLLARPDLAVS
jgi:hypothetical protein